MILIKEQVRLVSISYSKIGLNKDLQSQKYIINILYSYILTNSNKQNMPDFYFKSSCFSKITNQKPVFDKVQLTLHQASRQLPFTEFQPIYLTLIKAFIKKFQLESDKQPALQFLKTITNKYKPNLESEVRVLLFQVGSQFLLYPNQSLRILSKCKHMIIDTQFQYLLSKVFLQEAKIYETILQKELQIKSLTKSIKFGENFALQYLNSKQDIRKQIVQHTIMGYFQLYRLKKQQNHEEAEESIKKACRISQKNYGKSSQICQLLNLLYNQQRSIGKDLQKLHFVQKPCQRAITQIVRMDVTKEILVLGYYFWEEEKIVVQMINQNSQEQKVLSCSQYSIKLEMAMINELKCREWFRISQGKVLILEEQVLKVLGLTKQNAMTTRIGIRTISREQIIRKDTLSSSSKDQSFIQKEDFNFIRKFGRTQSPKVHLNY